MKIRIESKFVFFEDDEGKIMWHIDMIKMNKYRYLGEKEKKSFLIVREFLKTNHAELML